MCSVSQLSGSVPTPDSHSSRHSPYRVECGTPAVLVELIFDFDALRLKAEKLKGVEESCLDIVESSVPATIQIGSRIMFAILLGCGDEEYVLRVSGRVEDVAYAVDLPGRDKIYAKLTDVWPCDFFNPFHHA